MTNSSFKGVQALRGFAALSVVLFHFRWNINAVNPGLGDKLLAGGNRCRSVLSYKWLCHNSECGQIPSGNKRNAKFFEKEHCEYYLPTTLFCCSLFFLTGAMSTFHYQDKTANLISAITFMPIMSDHAPFYVDDNGVYGIRWTLNYEVMFYIFISVALLFTKRWLWVGFSLR
jgi:peptidoglycan/LPS O-acetylase OafA/YrhL